MVDFSKLLGEEKSPAPIDPTKIFHSLPRAGTKFDYLRDIQSEVLKAWDARRGDRDAVIKMNTGSGKTLVGLLILQSLLNEGVAPALYLCPTRQLVDQVLKTASEIGLNAVADGEDREIPNEFLNGEAIYVTTFLKLFNGRTVFGMPGGPRSVVPVGGLLVDDAHSCLSIAREQATISFKSNTDGYKQLYQLFKSSLEQQSAGKAAEIERGHPWTIMPVPFWSWLDQQKEVTRVLAALRDSDELKFSWDLLVNELPCCHCFVSGAKLQITPHIVPIDAVASFAGAKRRFFLSATLIDDSILLREFGVSRAAASKPLRPAIVGDIGERMIIAPSLVARGLEAEIPGICKSISEAKTNVVVLVPSFAEAESWQKAGAIVAKREEVAKAVEQLNASKGNFIVLANRYDGIDLPDDACRVLVLDGVPFGESYLERYTTMVRGDSALVTGRVAQVIEQGLGRGVRSGNDYCVVLLCNADLVRFVGIKDRLRLFSPETRQQFLIGQEIVRQSKSEKAAPIKKIRDLMKVCLARDQGWRSYHSKKMSELVPAVTDEGRLEIAEAEREACRMFTSGKALEASDCVQKKLVSSKGLQDADKGWFLQLAAMYRHAADPEKAQEMQRKAQELNRSLLRPIAGVRYEKLIARAEGQGSGTLAWVRGHTDPNAIVVSIDALATSLSFGIDHQKFEKAWQELGFILGLKAGRPEEELAKGPDGLWSLPEKRFLLFEIKNEVELSRTEIYQSETEQLSNSVNWFRAEYGDTASLAIFLVHPTDKLAESAYPPEGTRVITPARLDDLLARVRAFATALAAKAPDTWTGDEIGKQLAGQKLDAESLRTRYSVPARK